VETLDVKNLTSARRSPKAPAAPVLKRESKKRKEPEDYTGVTQNQNAVAGPSKRGRSENAAPNSKNTAVYVTGLPLDAEQDELVERFSRCGVIEEDDTGEPKVKMYANDDGSFIGEALVVYFKEDSVILAINLLDEAELRIGDSSTVMHVSKADFAHKNNAAAKEGGQPRRVVNKKKTTKRIGKMQKYELFYPSCPLSHIFTRKLLEWDDEDGFGPAKEPEDTSKDAQKNSRVVVLRHMFTLEDLEKDASLLLELKEDVREECSTLGEVTNVALYDVGTIHI
jgi:HIV Tat-specific factor 1